MSYLDTSYLQKLETRTTHPDATKGQTRSGLGVKGLTRLLTLPGQIVSLMVLVVPLLVALYMSFTDWSPTRGSLFDASFVGFENYSELLIWDTRFVYSIVRTILISVVCLSLEFVFGLGLAVLFMRDFRGKSLLFSAFLTPMMILPVVVGYTFWMLFQSNGPSNQIIERTWCRSDPGVVSQCSLRGHCGYRHRGVALDAAFLPDFTFRSERHTGESGPRRSNPGCKPAAGVLAGHSAHVETGHYRCLCDPVHGDYQTL